MAGDDFEKVVKLGSGSYGNVWLVSDKHCGQKLVMKEINLRGLNDKDIDQAMTEIQVLSKCKHQHIILYCSSFLNEEVSTLSIVMEHASMGDLHQQITGRRGLYFPDEVILRWFSQLASALEYIHDRCILHRDVKPQNVFVTGQQTIKLGDFGISRMFANPQEKANTLIGTPFYLSPEVCRQEPYSYASDMWAAGCVLYEMCCLCVPFTASNMAALAVKIELARFQPLPVHCGRILHTLVQSLLTSDPQKRLTARDIQKMDLVPPKHASVDSTTYTIVKHPKKTRPSLASPELSAMLHRQRSRPLEGQRAVQSAGNPHRNPRHRQEKKSAAPCFSLYQHECLDRKRLHVDDDGDDIIKTKTTKRESDVSNRLDALIRDVYTAYSSPIPRPHGQTASVIRQSLIDILGFQLFQDLLTAVKQNTQLDQLEKMSQFSVKLLPLFLLYVQMSH